MIDCSSPVSIERKEDKISFNGSVKQYRTFRKQFDKLLFSMIQPVAAKLPQEATIHKILRSGFDSDSESSVSHSRSRRS